MNIYNNKQKLFSDEDYKNGYNHFIDNTLYSTYPLIFFQMPESINFNKDTDILMTKEYEPKITTLRKSEYTSVNLIAMDGTLFIASYTTKTHAEIESVTNIARTIFVCIVLIIASLTFTKDA